MIKKIVFINCLLTGLLGACFLIYPPIRAWLSLRDPALLGPGIPKVAWRLCDKLTPRYAAWARQRVATGRPENLSMGDISGTEWPIFGSVFYLWAIENLQTAWESGDHGGGGEPKAFCREAILAASELVIDPRHATWVKNHWGADYLHKENVFYRMLVIGALTAREKLLHDGVHLAMLRDQVETFAKLLDASPHGLLDDYPHQCFPGDVAAAVACVRRADSVLGTDHSQFVARALRGFTGARAARLDLPPYFADATTGRPLSEARGCANSYLGLTTPELWPAEAAKWFKIYDDHFWQERWTAVGYREYARDVPKTDWLMDVDAGPVIAGHGISACAFGVGAARKNGRFDRAYPLATEMLACAWELPNGALAMPGMLSNLSDAPLLGEAAILWMLTVQPQKGVPIQSGGSVPLFVYLVLGGSLALGVLVLLAVRKRFRTACSEIGLTTKAPNVQAGLWAAFMVGAIVCWTAGWALPALVFLLLGLMLPIQRKQAQAAPARKTGHGLG